MTDEPEAPQPPDPRPGERRDEPGVPAAGAPAPGWYPDPEYAGYQRWWDGNQWSGAPQPMANHGPPGAPSSGFPTHPGGYASPPASTSNAFAVTAIVLGAIAFLFFPIILGPLAIVFAGIALSKGQSLAKVAMGVAIGGMVLGFVFGFLAAGF
jgi:hypothetical protein